MLINFPYIKRDSFVHELDPRTKLLLLFIFIFIVTQSSNFWFVLAGLTTATLYYRQARLTWKETKKAWVYIITLALTLVIVNYLVTAGAVVQGMDLSQQHILSRLPFFHFSSKLPFVVSGTLIVSVESITFVLTQLMRNISIGLFVIPITYTIDPAQMGVAFRGMGISDNIAYAIDLSLRFLPSVTRDFTATYDAQRARGFEIDKLRGGIFARIARLAPMIVPVIIGSIVCPYAQAWEDRINAIARDYASLGVRVLAINSNNALVSPSDSWENMIQRTHKKQFVFPYLYDESQDVARFYGAERTPEVFIFNAAGSLRYHGAPDDNYEDEQAVQHHYVREALDAILADQKASLAETKPVGCTIKWKKA